MKFKAHQVADLVNGNVEGDDQISIDCLSKIENGQKGSLSFLGNPKYNKYLYSSNSSIIIIKDDFVLEKPREIIADFFFSVAPPTHLG